MNHLLDQLPFVEHALPAAWFQRPTVDVARELLGATMVLRAEDAVTVVRIVETEAYLAEGDLACHAALRMTKRNAPMHEDGGIFYVYKIYGMHLCVNIVTETAGRGCAVLLRAAEPIVGHDVMRSRRANGVVRRDTDLLRGPGNLARALGVSIDDNYRSCASPSAFFHHDATVAAADIITTTRIGITASADLPLRFCLRSPAVSGKR
ncbi:MAG: DNA-3-methyladenine glycosylase [Bacteroidetes bacterium]|nr:DNA-3-methyladenine glycosylase [Bacteroidota bacterium]